MPVYYIIEESPQNTLQQEIHYQPNKHLQNAYHLLINKIIKNLIIVNDDTNTENNNQLQERELKNFLLSHYNGNIYLNGLEHCLELYKKENGIELDIDTKLAKEFDQFYFKLTIDVNDCDRFHQYQPHKFQNLIFGKIIV